MAQYYLVIKNGGEAVAEKQSLVLNNKTPSSVEYGVVENPPVDKDLHYLSIMSRMNAGMLIVHKNSLEPMQPLIHLKNGTM